MLTKNRAFAKQGWQGYLAAMQHIPLEIICLGINRGLARAVSLCCCQRNQKTAELRCSKPESSKGISAAMRLQPSDVAVA